MTAPKRTSTVLLISTGVSRQSLEHRPPRQQLPIVASAHQICVAPALYIDLRFFFGLSLLFVFIGSKNAYLNF